MNKTGHSICNQLTYVAIAGVVSGNATLHRLAFVNSHRGQADSAEQGSRRLNAPNNYCYITLLCF